MWHQRNWNKMGTLSDPPAPQRNPFDVWYDTCQPLKTQNNLLPSSWRLTLHLCVCALLCNFTFNWSEVRSKFPKKSATIENKCSWLYIRRYRRIYSNYIHRYLLVRVYHRWTYVLSSLTLTGPIYSSVRSHNRRIHILYSSVTWPNWWIYGAGVRQTGTTDLYRHPPDEYRHPLASVQFPFALARRAANTSKTLRARARPPPPPLSVLRCRCRHNHLR
jgi:hypothetical protein